MADYKKGDGYGSMYTGDGTHCDPTNPNMLDGLNAMSGKNKSYQTPHENKHENNKTVGTTGAKDVRGGAYKGKEQFGGTHSIPEHMRTLNGETLPKGQKNKTGKANFVDISGGK